MKQQTGIRMTVAAILGFIVLIILGFIWRLQQPAQLSDAELRLNGAIELSTPRIFSDFQLVDHRGTAYSLENLQGKWTILFLGLPTAPISARQPWPYSLKCMWILRKRKKKSCRW